MGFFADFVMLYNIKPLSLHRVFHGIRFKVNEDWEDSLFYFIYFGIRKWYWISSLIGFFIKIPNGIL